MQAHEHTLENLNDQVNDDAAKSEESVKGEALYGIISSDF